MGASGVTLVAGKGMNGYSNGGPTTAQFNNPAALAWYNASVMLVGDLDNYCIRTIDIPSKSSYLSVFSCVLFVMCVCPISYCLSAYSVGGFTRTLAGHPSRNFSLDGALATAGIGKPRSLAVVGDVIYWTDTVALTVRMMKNGMQ